MLRESTLTAKSSCSKRRELMDSRKMWVLQRSAITLSMQSIIHDLRKNQDACTIPREYTTAGWTWEMAPSNSSALEKNARKTRKDTKVNATYKWVFHENLSNATLLTFSDNCERQSSEIFCCRNEGELPENKQGDIYVEDDGYACLREFSFLLSRSVRTRPLVYWQWQSACQFIFCNFLSNPKTKEFNNNIVSS